MAICEEMQVQLQELVDLVKQDDQYTVAVAYGAVEADPGTAQAHQPACSSHRRTEAQLWTQVSPHNHHGKEALRG